jgi:hypothetical protein
MPALTPDLQQTFLATLAATGNVKASALAAGVHRDTAYALRASEPAFAAAWASALEDATDTLEAEARRRAVDGVGEPIFQGGKYLGEITKYSDTLLLALLKAHRPEKFRDKVTKHEHSGTVKIDLESRLRQAHEKLDALRKDPTP